MPYVTEAQERVIVLVDRRGRPHGRIDIRSDGEVEIEFDGGLSDATSDEPPHVTVLMIIPNEEDST